eukprot:gene9509-biopygen9511
MRTMFGVNPAVIAALTACGCTLYWFRSLPPNSNTCLSPTTVVTNGASPSGRTHPWSASKLNSCFFPSWICCNAGSETKYFEACSRSLPLVYPSSVRTTSHALYAFTTAMWSDFELFAMFCLIWSASNFRSYGVTNGVLLCSAAAMVRQGSRHRRRTPCRSSFPSFGSRGKFARWRPREVSLWVGPRAPISCSELRQLVTETSLGDSIARLSTSVSVAVPKCRTRICSSRFCSGTRRISQSWKLAITLSCT